MSEPEPIVVGPEVTPTTQQLSVLGTLIVRWTENASGNRLYCPLPCHEDQVVIAHPTATPERALIVCRVCESTYRLHLEQASDGSYFANFAVSDDRFFMSRKRRR